MKKAKTSTHGAISTNGHGGIVKKFEGSGSHGLTKIKDIVHSVKKEIPHSKDGKISALAWGHSKDDTRMAIVDQGGSCFVWDTYKTTRLYGAIYGFAQTIALSPDMAKPTILVGGMRNATVLRSALHPHLTGRPFATLRAQLRWPNKPVVAR